MPRPKPSTTETSLEEVLVQILKASSPMDVPQLCTALLWGMAQGNWRLPIIDYLCETVRSELQRNPSFVEDPPGSGRWRPKRLYTRRSS